MITKLEKSPKTPPSLNLRSYVAIGLNAGLVVFYLAALVLWSVPMEPLDASLSPSTLAQLMTYPALHISADHLVSNALIIFFVAWGFIKQSSPWSSFRAPYSHLCFLAQPSSGFMTGLLDRFTERLAWPARLLLLLQSDGPQNAWRGPPLFLRLAFCWQVFFGFCHLKQRRATSVMWRAASADGFVWLSIGH